MCSFDPFTSANVTETLTLSTNHLQKEYKLLLNWICETPKMTVVRVNLHKTKTNKIKEILKNSFEKNSTEILPIINTLDDIPEVVIIKNIESISSPIMGIDDVYVDCICAAAVLRGANIFAPGVLSILPKSKSGDTVNVFADLSKSILKGAKEVNVDKRFFVGIGIVRIPRYKLFGPNAVQSGIAIEMIKTQSGVPILNEVDFPLGHAMLQNLPSIVCGRVLNPKTNDLILDMCAAPGNKTTHLVELMNDQGTVIALDRSANKMKALQSKVESFGFKSVQCFTFDSTQALDKNHQDSSADRPGISKPPYTSSIFDRIILDAPCSGTGNRPQIQSTLSRSDLLSYPKVQKKLFAVAVELLKPGGVLVYSTCSINHNENESIVRWALDNFDNIELVPAEPLLGGPGFPGVGLDDNERLNVQRFGPNTDPLRPSNDLYNDSIGFFIAKFLKKNL